MLNRRTTADMASSTSCLKRMYISHSKKAGQAINGEAHKWKNSISINGEAHKWKNNHSMPVQTTHIATHNTTQHNSIYQGSSNDF
jgi:hypothetical protein